MTVPTQEYYISNMHDLVFDNDSLFLSITKRSSPFVSKHKVEQEADDTEDDPHCCQKVEDHYQPKLKGVNDFLWSAIRGYPICSNTNVSFLL